MLPSRLRLLSLPWLVAGLVATGQAAEPLSQAEREALEARVQALQGELAELQSRLREDTLASFAEPAEPKPEPTPELETSVAERRLLEEESARNPFAITAHRRNYLLPLSYNGTPNDDAFRSIDDENQPDRVEVKFQFSTKFNLAEDLLLGNGDLYFAYTQRSWWQAYNGDASSPFRETNYEPELFLDFDASWSLWGWTNINNRLAVNHQSNGRSAPLSRSWNRVIWTSAFVNDDWAVSLAPHWRIPESESEDDNPDIEDFMGYGDITVARRLHGDHEATLLWRGNPNTGKMGTQIDYSWPLFGKVRGHVQYYYGYGDSLIDYDQRTHSLGLGFSLNPLFSAGSFEE